mmetsp:Transcript_8921/g.13526  ORF Transcript_8921/g.13526 Transcript_8921/m.13526 type:complete len:120 (+) Transcript_8921:277-636(+)
MIIGRAKEKKKRRVREESMKIPNKAKEGEMRRGTEETVTIYNERKGGEMMGREEEKAKVHNIAKGDGCVRIMKTGPQTAESTTRERTVPLREQKRAKGGEEMRGETGEEIPVPYSKGKE